MDNSKALQVIKTAEAAGLAFVGQGLDTVTPLFKLEATQLAVDPRYDFHEIQGKYVFRKEVCDRCADAAGVDFIRVDHDLTIERAEAEPALDLPARSIFIGHAQGRVRLPDGSWRNSTPETYAFDYVAKAYAETTDTTKRKQKCQEYYKAGPMRAATGARLRVIRQLTGMPTAFEKQDIGTGKTFTFSRIVQNTDEILKSPEGRKMAMAMATGAVALLFGKEGQGAAPAASAPSAQPDPAEGARRVNPEPDDADDFSGFPGAGPAAQAPADTALEKAMRAIVDWSHAETIPPPVQKALQALIDRGETNLRILEPVAELCDLFGSVLPDKSRKISKDAAGAIEGTFLRFVSPDGADPVILADLLKRVRANAENVAKRAAETVAAK